MPRTWMLAALLALPLSACLTTPWTKYGYEVSGSRVVYVGADNSGILATVSRRPVRGADGKTFRVLGEGSGEYGADARHVYYRSAVLPFADPKTWRLTGNGYSSDGARMYYQGRHLEGANAATWRQIEGTRFGTDGKFVFYDSAPLPGVDGATFRARPHVIRWKMHSNEYNGRDARNFYRYNIQVGTVEDCGRKVGEGPNWADSGFHLYWGQEELDYLCADLKLPSESPGAPKP